MQVVAERYELRETLGVGGMGEVRAARDLVLERDVAVKLLRADLSRDPVVRERFLREARNAARLSHPNAVAVYDTGDDGGQPYLVMELVRGRTLAQALADGPLPEEDAVLVADAVLAALGAAHAAGIVHRDVKPGNILLSDGGGVKLADFGIAKGVREATAGLTGTGNLIGTAAYLSPEQVEGHRATPASDLYSAGVVMYEMLAGRPPFSADTPVALAVAHTARPVPPLADARPGLSPGLVGVVTTALSKDPAARYPDAEAMRQALRSPAVEATAVLPREGDGRRRMPLLLAAAAVLLLTAALAFAALDTPPDAAATRAEERGAGAPEDDASAAEPAQDPPRQEPASEDPAPTEPAEGAAPTEQAELGGPSDQDPPAAPAVTATTPEELLQVLTEHPDTYGSKQEDLRKELEKLLADPDSERAEKLLQHVEDWTARAELDPDVAALTHQLVAPLVTEPDDDDRGPPDEPPGKAKGRDEGDDGEEG